MSMQQLVLLGLAGHSASAVSRRPGYRRAGLASIASHATHGGGGSSPIDGLPTTTDYTTATISALDDTTGITGPGDNPEIHVNAHETLDA